MSDKKLSVALIGTNGLPARYGGFETLCEYLARNLNTDFDLYCYCSKTPKEKRLGAYSNTKLIYLPFKANGWQSMLYDTLSIVKSLRNHDVLVVLGASGFMAFPMKKFFKKRIIFNIGGIEWKKVRGSKLSAKLEIAAKKSFESIAVRNSDVVVVDNGYFVDYIKGEYGVNPVLIEYGGDHAKTQPITEELIKKYPFLDQPYDVTVSRAQEDMNIHMVIEAYKEVPDRTVVIVSNWHISEYGQNLRDENRGKYPNIILLDAIYNQDELNAIRGNASLYLHTHLLCGTAPSLVEAMSLGLPVICLDVPTNHHSTEDKSLYFKDTSSLIDILRFLDDDKLKEIGENMREIAQRRYTWKRISKLYSDKISDCSASNNTK